MEDANRRTIPAKRGTPTLRDTLSIHNKGNIEQMRAFLRMNCITPHKSSTSDGFICRGTFHTPDLALIKANNVRIGYLLLNSRRADESLVAVICFMTICESSDWKGGFHNWICNYVDGKIVAISSNLLAHRSNPISPVYHWKYPAARYLWDLASLKSRWGWFMRPITPTKWGSIYIKKKLHLWL